MEKGLAALMLSEAWLNQARPKGDYGTQDP